MSINDFSLRWFCKVQPITPLVLWQPSSAAWVQIFCPGFTVQELLAQTGGLNVARLQVGAALCLLPHGKLGVAPSLA